MNELNLNATVVKEVRYDATLANTGVLNFTVENCHVNAYIQKIVFYLDSADASFAAQTQITINDRGHSYPGPINGFIPITYAAIGTSVNNVSGGTNTQTVLNQLSTRIVEAYVNSATQDSEGIGNIYVKLTRTIAGVATPYTAGFTMAVIYQPQTTLNSKINTRNQVSNEMPMRVLSQAGLQTYIHPTTAMIDQTHNVSLSVNPRNNADITTFGFSINSSNPFFYFGTPYPTKRWFLGFSSDNTPNIGLVTFRYFDGSNFVGFAATNVFSGALGPGTYQFANDGVIIFSPSNPSSWKPTVMSKDPNTVYNSNILGLGTLASNNLVNNPSMYWIQCQVGFATTTADKNNRFVVSAVVPLIDPDLSLKERRRLIPS
jgi:hypothetical protein